MAVTRMPSRRGKRFRKNVKARSAWTRRKDVSSDRAYRSVVNIRQPDFGYPDKIVTNMRYVDTISLTGASLASNVFSMNSLFDPDVSGIGHQPMYFDQLCGAVGSAPYSRYRVLGAKATISFKMTVAPSAQGANNYGNVIVGLAGNTVGGLFASDASGLMEAANTVYTYLGEKSGGSDVKTLRMTYSPTRDLGVDTGDDSITGQYNTNPSAMFYVIPWKFDTNASGANVQALVQLEYRVEFYRRNEVSKS